MTQSARQPFDLPDKQVVQRASASETALLCLRPQSIGSIFRSSVRLYRAHFVVLFVLYVIPQVPLQWLYWRWYSGATIETWHIVLLYLMLSVQLLLVAPITIAVSEACLGIRPMIRRSLNRGLARRPWRVVGIAFVSSFAAGAAAVPFIIPGLIVAARLMLAVPVGILEDLGVRAALRRSWQLSSGYAARNIGYFFTVYLAAFVVSLVVSAVVLLSALAIGLDITKYVWVGGATMLLISPFIAMLPILLYYDLRVRKEDYNFETLEQDLLT